VAKSYLVSNDQYTEGYEWVPLRAFDNLADAHAFAESQVGPVKKYDTTGSTCVTEIDTDSPQPPKEVALYKPDELRAGRG
jgi:hypothetical protein